MAKANLHATNAKDQIAGRTRAELDAAARDAAADLRDKEAASQDAVAIALDLTAAEHAARDVQRLAAHLIHEQSRQTGADEDWKLAIRDRRLAAADRNLAAADRTDTSGNDNSEGSRDAALAASQRDIAAGLRDRQADVRNVAAIVGEGQAASRAATDRRFASAGEAREVAGRMSAAAARARSAIDRVSASRDRQFAAADRALAAQDRDDASTDALTGVRRRGAGLDAIRREVDRAHRTKVDLVAAYIDVDGLKATNDAVARALRDGLRTYDVITRVGGDEFVCILPSISLANAQLRFDAVSAALAVKLPGASITVGLALLGGDDSADDLVHRADSMVAEAQHRVLPR